MAYIGFGPLNTFSPVPSKDSFTGDGSTTTFDLENEVVFGGENALEVFVDNVRQEPGTGKAYTLGLDGSLANKRITFSAAPASGAAIYVINDKTSSTSTITPSDLNGAELILDADADSSITADTDDRIDFKIANGDRGSNGLSSFLFYKLFCVLIFKFCFFFAEGLAILLLFLLFFFCLSKILIGI